jgi:flagellar hook-associated protein 3 FlgL
MINATGNRMMREIQRQSRLSGDVADLQILISSGRRIQRASDDPIAAARVANIRARQSDGAAWARSVNLGTALVDQADTALASVSSLLARAQELTLAASNPTANASDRATLAIEMTAIADEIDVLSNSQSALGGPLFSTAEPMAMRFDKDTVFAPVPSRSSAFEVAGTAISAQLRTAGTAIATGNTAKIATSLTDVKASINHVANVHAEIGISAGRLERLRDTQAGTSISLSAERSTLEDADLTSAIAKLNGQTITLEAAQAAFARINRRTLIDILR